MRTDRFRAFNDLAGYASILSLNRLGSSNEASEPAVPEPRRHVVDRFRRMLQNRSVAFRELDYAREAATAMGFA